ncbi:MAG TPA: hypothetical protein VFX03_08420 [Thermomicrobiales bacterium]|nr:hypothetical protein [Thermomicrobiales bacterium]
MSGASGERRRAHVVLPGELINEIDARVGQRHRSQFIQNAVEDKLRRLRRVEAFERILESPDEVGIPEWGTRESTSDWLRGLREEWDRTTSPEPVGS